MSLNIRYKSNRNIVYSCKYHIIWCSKYRRKVLVIQIAISLNVEVIEIETDKDHVHILAEIDPQFGVNKFVRIVKGKTSRLLRNEFSHLRSRLPTLWTNSYFVSTVGGAPLSIVKQYIASQQLSESKKSRQRWNDFLERGQRMVANE